MRNKRIDIEIGCRAAQEARRLALKEQTDTAWLKKAGLCRNDLFNWKNGMVPTGSKLARLHYAGADVIYILTGRHSEGVNNA